MSDELKVVVNGRRLKFKGVSSLAELRAKLEEKIGEDKLEKELNSVESELSRSYENDVQGGMSSRAIREVYLEEVWGRYTAGSGGNEPAGKRKTMRECRGKRGAECEGNWDANL